MAFIERVPRYLFRIWTDPTRQLFKKLTALIIMILIIIIIIITIIIIIIIIMIFHYHGCLSG